MSTDPYRVIAALARAQATRTTAPAEPTPTPPLEPAEPTAKGANPPRRFVPRGIFHRVRCFLPG